MSESRKSLLHWREIGRTEVKNDRKFSSRVCKHSPKRLDGTVRNALLRPKRFRLAPVDAQRPGPAARSAWRPPIRWITFFPGHALMNKGQTADTYAKARFHYDRALELDPDNVDALVGRAGTDLALVMNWLSVGGAARSRATPG